MWLDTAIKKFDLMTRERPALASSNFGYDVTF